MTIPEEALVGALRRGLSTAQIAAELGVSTRTVGRWRKQCALPATYVRPLPEHGTRSRYTREAHPCRCEPCRAANALYATQTRSAYRSATRPAGEAHTL